MTGTREDRILEMISRIEDPRPPGVYNSSSTASSPLFWAESIARETYSSVLGWMASSSTTFKTSGLAVVVAEEEAQNANKINANWINCFMVLAAAALSPRAWLRSPDARPGLQRTMGRAPAPYRPPPGPSACRLPSD